MIEEFFQFGKSRTIVKYSPDKVAIKLLNKISKKAYRFVHVVNAYSGKVLRHIPKARQDLPMESQNEAIHCASCNTYIPIRRAHPKITSSSVLSSKTSTYITQPLEYCRCRQSAVLIDHRGILRVYGEVTKLSLVNYLANFPIHHKLSNQKHAEIASSLLDGVKPRFERITRPRWMWMANTLDLTYLNLSERQILLPVPITNFGKRRNINRVVKDYYQLYAYNYQILILTTDYIILPSGIAIPRTDPMVAKLLDPKISTTRTDYKKLELVNRLAEEFVTNITAYYNLPVVELKYLPFQTMGYSQLVKRASDKPIEYKGKFYIPDMDSKAIATTRRVSAVLLRDLLNNTNNFSRVKHRNFAKMLPALHLAYSARFLRPPPTPKQSLKQRNRTISLA